MKTVLYKGPPPWHQHVMLLHLLVSQTSIVASEKNASPPDKITFLLSYVWLGGDLGVRERRKDTSFQLYV